MLRAMLTRDDIRAAALARPEAHEAPHFDLASFRVNRKEAHPSRFIQRIRGNRGTPQKVPKKP